MNKKTNTFIFLALATIFNILVTAAAFVLLLVLYGKLLVPILPDSVKAYGLIVVFIAAIVLSFVAYKYAVKFFLSKVDADKTFDPLFKPRRPRPRKD